MGAADGAVYITAVPSKFEKGDNAARDIFFIVKQFHGAPDKHAVQEERDKGIPSSLSILMAGDG